MGLAAGFEFRKEHLTDTRTVENETGNVVGGGEGFGYTGNFERTTLNSLGVLSPIDIDGTDPVPLVRGNGTLAWRKGKRAASVFVGMVGHLPPAGLTTNPETLYANQWRVNPQVSYSGIWGSKVTAGVRNGFDKAPPRYLDNSTGCYNGVGSAEPAFWYMRISREF